MFNFVAPTTNNRTNNVLNIKDVTLSTGTSYGQETFVSADNYNKNLFYLGSNFGTVLVNNTDINGAEFYRKFLFINYPR